MPRALIPAPPELAQIGEALTYGRYLHVSHTVILAVWGSDLRRWIAESISSSPRPADYWI